MKKQLILLSVMLIFAVYGQQAILDAKGVPLNGLVNANVLIYDSAEGGTLIWAGTTDGSSPALRVRSGNIENLYDVIPSYIRDRGELWIEIHKDTRPLTDSRIHFTASSELRREAPTDPGDITETLEDELQIGLPGHELYVASTTTGFGVDTPVERVTVDGAIGLREGTAPTATTDFGKVYVDDSDGHLYYMDEGGSATDLLETSSVTGGGNILASFHQQAIHLCIDQTRWLGVDVANTSTPYTHLWTGDTSPLSATNIPSPSFTASSAGTYHLTYTITDADGNSSLHLFHIVVHASPSPTISASPAVGSCIGQPVRLAGDGCFDKYCWDGGPCSKVFEITEDGSYVLTVIDKWGCEGTASRSITFLDPPVASAGTDIDVCLDAGDIPVGGSPSAVGGTPPYFYEWYGTGATWLSSINTANPNFDTDGAPEGAYSLILTVTDANGCEDSDGPIIVTVNPNPTGTAASNSPVCPGADIELYGSASAGSAPYSYSWTGPSGFTSFLQNPVISGATSGNAGTYSLTVTDDIGCTATVTTTSVTLLDAPAITSHPSDASISTGATATFSVTASGSGTLTYQWQLNTGSSWADISGATSSSYTTPTATSGMDGYQYRCIVSGTCTPAAVSNAATLSIVSSGSVTFTYTGSVQTWTVPGGVTSITGECWGAEGGVTSGVASSGGRGGYAKADIPVTPGETLNIYVGGMGPSVVSTATGGWNGGGGTDASSDATGCGGGGTDIRRGTVLADRLLVAGGGGGAGYEPSSYPTNVGGSGGGLTGSDGGTASWCSPSCNGKGGTQVAGGAGGQRTSEPDAGSGSFGSGGRGKGSSNGGGGGGGGWYGGGGGQATAGGGGSSYVAAPGNTSTLTTAGVRTGNGEVQISW